MRVGAAIRRRVRSAASAIEKTVFPEATSGGDQWQREVMDAAVAKHIASLGPGTLAACEISGDNHADRGWERFSSLNYPEFDLCAPVESPGEWDVVICEQVLEHVIDPFVAAQNLAALCRHGGHVIVTSPFLIKQHELPMFGMLDYWRFTPRGLRVLLERSGFEVDEVGSWGNRIGVLGNLGQWAGRRRWLPNHNDPSLAVQTWAFARRIELAAPPD